MAVTRVSGEPPLAWGVPPGGGRRAVLHSEWTLRQAAGTVSHLFTDVPSWPLWISPVVGVTHVSGPAAGRGAVNVIALGFPAVHTDVLHKTVLVSPGTVVYAGRSGRAVRFLDVVDIEATGERTRVRRRLDLRVAPAAAALAPAVTTLARRLIRHSVDLLL